MEKKNEEKGLDNSFFMKEKSETSFREERKSQSERGGNGFSSNRGFGSDGSKRRSFNPNFDSENRPKGFNSHREPVYKTRQGENSVVGEGNKNRRPRIRRNEEEGNSSSYGADNSRSPFRGSGNSVGESSSPFGGSSSYRERPSYDRQQRSEGSSYSNSYNREGRSSYNNREQRGEGSSYNRSEGRGGSSYNREGGSSYGGRNNSSYGNRNNSSYNREGGSSYNREGGASYGRDSRRDNSSYNRRDSYNNSYNRENGGENRGSYSRSSYNRDGEQSSRPSYGRREGSSQYGQRDGGYSRENGSRERNSSYSQSRPQSRSYNNEGRNGGYERSGGYNREGGYNRDNRYSNRDNGGYSSDNRRGGRDDRDGAKKRFKSTAPFMPMPVMNEEIRLNRYVAMSGVCSRREADEIIKAGEITINGEVKTELGIRVQPGDVVCHNGEQLSGEKLVYIVMNKPKNAVTTVEDPNAETTVIDILGDKVQERVFPVGRLDKNSMGVIILTNDGVLAKELTHPSYEKKKIYHVFLDKPVGEEDMEQLANGVELEDGMAYADELSYVSEDTREVGIEIHSGRNRIIRRMFEHLGYKVMKLDRVYFAGITKKGLKRGFWRYLTAQEVGKLKNRSTRK